MRAREEVAAEIQEKLDSVAEDIRSQYYNLGLYLSENASHVKIPMGINLLDSVKSAKADKERAASSLEEARSFLKDYKALSDEAEGLKDQINVKRGENKMIKLRLGALIYEQCSLSLLPEELFSDVYKDVSEERKYRERAESNAFLDKLFSKHGKYKLERSNDSRFLSYAESVVQRKLSDALNGDNAKSLFIDAAQSDDELTRLNALLDDKVTSLKAMDERRRSLEKGELKKLESAEYESGDKLREAEIGYGNYLFDKGASWIGEDTPAVVLDYLDSILKSQQEYASLTSTMNRLKKEAKADDYKALIEDEKAKILILQKEKERIDQQIAQIENEIERLEGSIDRLSLY